MKASAFAPATVANVAVGFDILGFAINGLGDTVTVEKVPKRPDIFIQSISGIDDVISLSPEQNTAGKALLAMKEELSFTWGLKVTIKKGIPLSSGLGGSAASAVAAVLAANQLLSKPLRKKDLFQFCLAGEEVASKSIHGDNVAPCLFGGLNLILDTLPLRNIIIPIRRPPVCVAVHPQIKVETKTARGILKETVPLVSFVKQTSRLAGFLHAMENGDHDLLKLCLEDKVIEPQRESLIPGFQEAKKAALTAGALGFSISGSGPTVFAFAENKRVAKSIGEKIQDAFLKRNLKTSCWVSEINSKGAMVIKS